MRPSPDPLDALLLARLDLTAVALADVHFRQPPATTLWSTVGAFLADTHPALYERLVKPTSPHGDLPSPWIVSSPLAQGTYAAGTILPFSMTLVGWAIQALEPLFEALAHVEQTGLGAQRDHGKGTVYFSSMHSVIPDERRILLVDRGLDVEMRTLPVVRGGEFVHRGPSAAWLFETCTPVALKVDGALHRAPPFDALVTRLAARVSRLVSAHGDVDVDLRPLLGGIHAVRTRAARWSWATAERWSGSQRQAVPMDGAEGQVVVDGLSGPLLTLLRAGTWLHVGKNTERGMGAYRLRPLPHF